MFKPFQPHIFGHAGDAMPMNATSILVFLHTTHVLATTRAIRLLELVLLISMLFKICYTILIFDCLVPLQFTTLFAL